MFVSIIKYVVDERSDKRRNPSGKSFDKGIKD